MIPKNFSQTYKPQRALRNKRLTTVAKVNSFDVCRRHRNVYSPIKETAIIITFSFWMMAKLNLVN